MPVPIECLVVGALRLTVFTRWNFRRHALRGGLSDDGITVITAIPQQVVCTQALDQRVGMRTISLCARYVQAYRARPPQDAICYSAPFCHASGRSADAYSAGRRNQVANHAMARQYAGSRKQH